MATTSRAKSDATLRFLAKSGVTGVRGISEIPQRDVAAKAHDGGHEKQDDEAGEHERQSDGTPAAARHVLRRKRLLVHDAAQPTTCVKGTMPRIRSAMMAAKMAKR